MDDNYVIQTNQKERVLIDILKKKKNFYTLVFQPFGVQQRKEKITEDSNGQTVSTE